MTLVLFIVENTNKVPCVEIEKAQISILENSLADSRFDTIVKVFKAFNAKINFSVELLNENLKPTTAKQW